MAVELRRVQEQVSDLGLGWQPAFVNVDDAQDTYVFSSVGCTSLKANLHVVAAAGAELLHGGAVPWATSAVPASTASCMS